MKKSLIILTFLLIGCGGGGSAGSSSSSNLYKVRITNSSAGNEITLANGKKTGAFFSPTLVLVHKSQNPLFMVSSRDLGEGLENFVEDLDPSKLLASLQLKSGTELIGLGSKPEGTDAPAVLANGQSYVVTIRANQDDRISVVSSLVLENDTFFATSQEGELLSDILSNNGRATINVFDLGTEVNEPIALGTNQPLNQTSPGAGQAENSVVTNSNVLNSSLLSVTITPSN